MDNEKNKNSLGCTLWFYNTTKATCKLTAKKKDKATIRSAKEIMESKFGCSTPHLAYPFH